MVLIYHLLLVAVSGCVMFAQASNVLIGCYSYPNALQGQSMTLLPDPNSSCMSYCNERNQVYSYDHIQPSTTGTGNDNYCYCTATAPSQSYMIDDALCQNGDPTTVTVFANVPGRRMTDGLDRTCWDLDPAPPPDATVNTALECMAICPRYAIVVYRNRDSSTNCFCEGYRWFEELVPTTCRTNVIFPYEMWNDPPVTPSAFVKRQEKRRLELEQDQKRDVCPSRLTGCNVIGGDELSYECIDTENELEACGGCINGEFTFEPPINTTSSLTGIDCTSLPGVSADGVACTGGHCLIYACEDGFELEEGDCIPL
ncbi:uncharacterized protein IL334_003911 [Kwoniella shivajii]|uniref:Protein CPL1-like domain-containing protein n=1 Tax=Kwoniella shivajii TaxID=564305 RepID=A0ABZ1CZA0_9TREE|nr:hypothetical protein IL334_003911 [Kwoniella shivajii]